MCALFLAFTLLKQGVRPHQGSRDRIDGGVDGDYGMEGDFTGGDGGLGGKAFVESDDESIDGDLSSNQNEKTMSREQIHKAMRRGAVRYEREGDELSSTPVTVSRDTMSQANSQTEKSPSTFSSLMRFFGGGDDESSKSKKSRVSRERKKSSLHVTRDPTTGHLTMNDVGVGAFLVSQPRPCAPIASEADGEKNSVTQAMVALRTEFRVGKILRQCDKVKTSLSFGVGYAQTASQQSRTEQLKTAGELFYAQLLRTQENGWGPLCYTPDFLRGVASTVSVCSRNHEDGVALVLFGFISFSDNRVLIALSDKKPNEPERGASAYLVHNHGFAGMFLDRDVTASETRTEHYKSRGVRDTVGVSKNNEKVLGDESDGTLLSPQIPAARCVHSKLTPDTVGGVVRDTLDAMEGVTWADEWEERRRSSRNGETESDDDTQTKKNKPLKRRELDLLTVDVSDGIYLIQPLLTAVNPMIVAVAYDSIFGPEMVLTGGSGRKEEMKETESEKEKSETENSKKKYRREGDFDALIDGEGVDKNNPIGIPYGGSSLSALIKVLRRWGFYFVGCEAAGEAGFFIRSDVIEQAHKAGRGSVHVTTPSDSGCFSSRETRNLMRRFVSIEPNADWVTVNDDWLEEFAPGPNWREDDVFLQ